MSYISDYCFYNSGNECPEAYHMWSCLAAMSTVISRKIWLNRGYFKLSPNIYVALVGDAGSGKNTAKDCAVYKLLLHNFPDIPISASVTSREDVAKFMGSEECLRTFRHPDGTIEEYRPFFFAVSELSNLLSVDSRKMTDFLVELYDGVTFSTSFKRDTVKDKVPNPCSTMLACCVPDWIMRSLRMDLFTGGLGRRLILVHENRTILKANPAVPEGGKDAWERVVSHLKAVNELIGEVKMSPDCKKWWDEWYENPERLKTNDPILKQFFATKHVMMQKVAILLMLCEQPFKMVVEAIHMQQALAMFAVLEPGITKLSQGIGRNEMAVVSLELLDTLHFHNGIMSDKMLRVRFFRDCKISSREYDGLLQHLTKTEQIFMVDIAGSGERLVMLPANYEAMKKDKGIK